MSHFICPVCGADLNQNNKVYICENNHSYDIAKCGYVNLLQSQKSGKKRHGDDKLMVRCRKAFLEKGYYQCLLDEIIRQCKKQAQPFLHIVDVGCGEGWYSDNIYKTISTYATVQMEGVDISKDALSFAAKRNSEIAWAVASSGKLPIRSASCDILLNLFAPLDETEFARIIKKGGLYIRAIALERHLWGLKELIYEYPYENKPVVPDLLGFHLLKRIDIKKTICLEQKQDIENLFKMTPYYYKTSIKDQEKLSKLTHLETPIEFAVLVYKKTK